MTITDRDRKILAVVAALAALAGAYFLLIAPKRNEASRLGAQLTTTRQALAVERSSVAAGESARTQYHAYYEELARLGEAVPSDDDVPQLIVEVQRAARQSGVDFRSLALSGTASSEAPAAPAAPVTTTTTTTSSASSATSSTATAAALAASAAALPPGVAESSAGLPEEPFSLTFTGSFFHLADFLGRLQHFVTITDKQVAVSGRLMTLNAISFGSGPNGFPQISATVSATTYLVPQTQTTSTPPVQ